jgi:DNA-binding transcriptional ArsR family regulator
METLAPLEAKLSEIALILLALANKERLITLWRLAASGGELPLPALACGRNMSQSALSQHLARLRERGIVAARRSGRNVFYRLADPRFEQLAIAIWKIFASESG